MADKIPPSLITLPVETVYRILDHLNDFTMFCSMPNVCSRMNAILNSYHRYQVHFFFISTSDFPHLQIIIQPHNISSLCSVFFCWSETIRSNTKHLLFCCKPIILLLHMNKCNAQDTPGPNSQQTVHTLNDIF